MNILFFIKIFPLQVRIQMSKKHEIKPRLLESAEAEQILTPLSYPAIQSLLPSLTTLQHPH